MRASPIISLSIAGLQLITTPVKMTTILTSGQSYMLESVMNYAARLKLVFPFIKNDAL